MKQHTSSNKLHCEALESATRSLMNLMNQWEHENNKMFHKFYPRLEQDCFDAIDSKSSHRVMLMVSKIETIIND